MFSTTVLSVDPFSGEELDITKCCYSQLFLVCVLFGNLSFYSTSVCQHIYKFMEHPYLLECDWRNITFWEGYFSPLHFFFLSVAPALSLSTKALKWFSNHYYVLATGPSPSILFKLHQVKVSVSRTSMCVRLPWGSCELAEWVGDGVWDSAQFSSWCYYFWSAGHSLSSKVSLAVRQVTDEETKLEDRGPEIR